MQGTPWYLQLNQYQGFRFQTPVFINILCILITQCNAYNGVTGNCNSSLLISNFQPRITEGPAKLITLLSSSIGQLVVMRGSASRIYSQRTFLSVHQLRQRNTIVNINGPIGFTYQSHRIPEWQNSTTYHIR